MFALKNAGCLLGRRVISKALFCIILALVAYLSLRANPEISSLPLPSFLNRVAVWFDLHDFAKNLIGYSFLGLALRLAVSPSLTSFSPSPFSSRLFSFFTPSQLVVVLGIPALASVLECIQMFMPLRVADPHDVAAAVIAGLIVGTFCKPRNMQNTRTNT